MSFIERCYYMVCVLHDWHRGCVWGNRSATSVTQVRAELSRPCIPGMSHWQYCFYSLQRSRVSHDIILAPCSSRCFSNNRRSVIPVYRDVYDCTLMSLFSHQSLNCLLSLTLCVHIYFFEGNVSCLTTCINIAWYFPCFLWGKSNSLTSKHFVIYKSKSSWAYPK